MLKPEITDTSPQGLFDYVVAHLRQQGRPASDVKCLYRTPDGLACAVGCLITDETAQRWDSERKNSLVSLIDRGLVEEPVILANADLLMSLQYAHDSGYVWRDARLEDELAGVAQLYKLVYTPPTVS